MASLFARSILFLCSYFPLVTIFCILLWSMWPLWAVLLLASIGLASLLLTLIYFQRMRNVPVVHTAKVSDFTQRDADVMSYIASYIIPFVSFSLTSVQQALALGVFFLVLFLIYVHSNMIYINPVLNVAGYHLYEIEIEQGQFPRFYITRQRLKRNQEICFTELSDDIYLEH